MKSSRLRAGGSVANVFISYARRDRERVHALASALERESLSVWWDTNLVPGRRFREMLASELEAADSVVVVWTAASLASDYVHDEAEEARERGVLVPVILEPVRPPAGFRQVQAADLSQWTGSAQHPEFQMLLKAISTLVEVAHKDEAVIPAADGGVRAAVPAPVETTDTPDAAPTPHAAHGRGGLRDIGFVSRAFDVYARPVVWLSAAVVVALTGMVVGFGLSGVAAASEICAGALALACLSAGVGPTAKTLVMATPLAVAMIITLATRSAGGIVAAVLVASILFGGCALTALVVRTIAHPPVKAPTATAAASSPADGRRPGPPHKR